ncbi:MAG: DUF2125 domain-containing protein [Fuscovulum sp.]|nr:DUF2125 domain-containing protein [Fuscovulum sp.]
MFRYSPFAAAPALLILLSGTAHAALTADQVWQSWKDGGAAMGLAITAATEANSDGVLTLNGVTITPAGAPTGFTISDMTLTEEDDGTVTIEPGAAMGLDIAEGANAAKVAVTHEGLAIVAREENGGLVYDYSADKMDVDFDIATEGYSFDDTQPKPVVKNTGKLALEALEGSYSDTPGANRAFGLDVTADKMALTTASDDPGMQMKTSSDSETTELAMALDVVLPSTTPLATIQGPADFRKVLEEGFSVDVALSQGVSTGNSSQQSEFFSYDLTLTSQPGEAAFGFDKDTFSVVSKGAGLEASMTSAAVPAPIEVSIGEVATNIALPIMATAPADLLFQMKLSQLTLSDGVWGLFDPGAALKREPFDLNIDLSGKSTLDLIGMAEAEETGAMPPIPAPEKLDITDISLKVAGAALNAVGSFTFDNSMGMPMPLGEATVNVSGANALIDGLIATGIITEEDAMGARMMMGMFMVPAGDDALTSKIEVKEGMQVMVNGQPLPM